MFYPDAFYPDQDMPLTMAQGMKRLGTPIAALLGLALIALIATSWLLNRDALRRGGGADPGRDRLDLVSGQHRHLGAAGELRSFHDVGLKGRQPAIPRSRRRADRQSPAAAAATAAVRDRRS